MNALLALLLPLLKREAVKLAERAAYSDQPDLGEWLGKPLDIVKIGAPEKKMLGIPLYATNVYRIAKDAADPLRFHHFGSGIEFSTFSPIWHSDLGSIPRFAQGHHSEGIRLNPEDDPEAYGFHDDHYSVAKALVRKPGEAWRELALDRVQADVLLYWYLSCASPSTGIEPTRAEAQIIYRGVRSPGGALAWKRHRSRGAA